MIRAVVAVCILLFMGAAQADCVLKPGQQVSKRLIGKFRVDMVYAGGIGFDSSLGDMTKDRPKFNLDSLYEMRSATERARFRIAEMSYVNGKTYLGNAQWENDARPVNNGDFDFYEVKVKPEPQGETVTMVGDSITWWSAGKNFRCLRSQKMTGISFVGPHTDAFGYGHAGEGGNTTFDILKRLDKIGRSDIYFVLAGTNDWGVSTAAQTASNIKVIAKKLSSRGGTVIVSTLLPRMDEHDARNLEVDQLLLAWGGSGCNCKVVDLSARFRQLSNQKALFWDTGVHPNLQGYEKISDIVASLIATSAASNRIAIRGSQDSTRSQ